MKAAHRAGKDCASCGHFDSGGAPDVLINGKPAMRARVDNAGSLVVGPGAKEVLVNGYVLSLVGDSVVAHGKGRHDNPTIASGSPDVFAMPGAFGKSEPDESANAGLAQFFSGTMKVLYGMWTALENLFKIALEHPKEAAALFILCSMFPNLGLLLAVGGGLASAVQLGHALRKVANLPDGPEKDAALVELGNALANLGLSAGPTLLKALGKISPAMLARAGAAFNKVMAGRGDRWTALKSAIEGLWNDPILVQIRNVLIKEPPRVLPKQAETKIPMVSPAHFEAVLRFRGITLRASNLTTAQDEALTEQLIFILPLLRRNSNITVIQAWHPSNPHSLYGIRGNGDGTSTLFINVDYTTEQVVANIIASVRTGRNSNYTTRVLEGEFRSGNLNAANVFRRLIHHEFSHAEFNATRDPRVADAASSFNWGELRQAIRGLDPATKQSLNAAYARFEASRGMLRANFTEYSATSIAEFKSEVDGMKAVNAPIPPLVQNLYNSLFNKGAPFGPTRAPPPLQPPKKGS